MDPSGIMGHGMSFVEPYQEKALFVTLIHIGKWAQGVHIGKKKNPAKQVAVAPHPRLHDSPLLRTKVSILRHWVSAGLGG